MMKAEKWNQAERDDGGRCGSFRRLSRMLHFISLLTVLLLAGLLLQDSEALQAWDDLDLGLSQDDLKFLYNRRKEADSPHSVVNIKTRSREKRSSPTLTTDPGLLDLTIEDEGEDVEFELRPNDALVSPEFLLVVRGKEGVQEERGIHSPSCIYIGAAKNKVDTTAALANCDGRGFTGVVVSRDSSYLVRPLSHTRRRRQTSPEDGEDDDDEEDEVSHEGEDEDDVTHEGYHIIHRRNKRSKCAMHNFQAMRAPPRVFIKLSDIEAQENKTKEDDADAAVESVINEKKSEELERLKRQASEGERLQIETAVFVDNVMYEVIRDQNPGSDVITTVTEVVFAIMNGVHLLYNAPSLDMHFSITLVRVDIIESADEGPPKASGDIQRYLSNFCSWQKKLNQQLYPLGDNSVGAWDHALMLSGLDLWDQKPEFDSVIGLAWVSGMCHPTYSCTINEGTSFEAVYVITHEMGHNLGMAHDGSVEDKNLCSEDSHIMSSSTGPGKVTWSKCSNDELRRFLQNNDYSVGCLTDLTRGPRHLRRDKHDKLPGEVYTLTQQCTFALGSTFKPYVTSKNPYNNICRETWCQNTTHAMRTHPALEGTSCVPKKFCINGQCVVKPKKAITTTTTTSTTTTTPPSTTTTTTTTTTERSSRGFRSFFERIRNLFKRYLYLRDELPPTVFEYRWTIGNLTKCSANCGGGWREGKVLCSNSGGHVLQEDKMCEPLQRPSNRSSCNTTPCKGETLPQSSSPSNTLSFPP